jgi:uncharacterized MnhB-related membrane protein
VYSSSQSFNFLRTGITSLILVTAPDLVIAIVLYTLLSFILATIRKVSKAPEQQITEVISIYRISDDIET